MRIDSHQHYWRASRGDYHWMGSAVQPLCRDFLPNELVPQMHRYGIERTVLVQAAQTEAETDFLLQLAEAEPTVAGVVGWLDLDADKFPSRFEHYRRNPKFIGLRPMLHDLPDDRWILRDRVQAHLALMAEADFPFEFLTFPRHLPHVIAALERHGALRAVIDHLSKPAIRTKQIQPWADLMSRLAQFPNVFCKVSGMVTEADLAHWSVSDLQPYVAHVWSVFGPDRLMFGSDWPVCTLAASYDRVIEATDTIIATLASQEEKSAFFGENSRRFYNR